MIDDQKPDSAWTPQGWAVIIGAVFLGLTQIAQMYLGYLRETNKVANDAKAEATIQKVIENQDTTHEELKTVVVQQVKAAEKVATTAAKVEEIHAQTAAIADKVEAKPSATSP